MKIGTKSVLFGAHCFFLHPWFVAWSWYQLHGFKDVHIGMEKWSIKAMDRTLPDLECESQVLTSLTDPKLWLAFFVHDLGYWGKPNMDGPEGESHPEWGANFMRRFGQVWHDFVLYHSRFLAKQRGAQPSVLCIADKLAIALEPWWFYLPRVNLSGEIWEYMGKSGRMANKGEPLSKYETMQLDLGSQKAWNTSMKSYIRRWVEEHKDGRVDTWTPTQKEAIDEHGVWK